MEDEDKKTDERKAKRKRRLTVNKWKVYRRQMEGRECEDLSSMNMETTQVGDELNEEMDKWWENRSGWVNDRVKECIDQRRSANKNYRHMRKICGVDDVRTKHMKDMYMRKKEAARQEVGMALHLQNEMVMKKMCEGGNKSGLYEHLKMLIRKGKENNDSKVKLVNEDGETVDDKRKRGPTEGACSMAVLAMSTRPMTSALRMPSTHPIIRNANHR